MKTPHRLTLLIGSDIHGKYNPVTDSYEQGNIKKIVLPCLVNVISNSKQLKDYGSQTEKVISCRFMQEIKQPFSRAIFDGEIFERMDSIDAPIKGAVKLKRVVE